MIKKLITKFIFLLVFMLSGSFCFSQRDTSVSFESKTLEMRKLRKQIDKNKPTQTTNRTTSYADGGLVSFTPKSPNSSLTTSINITAGTIPPKIYNYEYATDMCSMLGPSNQITSDGYYEWDVSYDNGTTWQLGAAGQGSSLQLGVVTQSALYRRYCYPWDPQGSINNGCGPFYSNVITINVASAPVNGVNGGGISISSSTSNNCLGRTVTLSSTTDASTTTNTPIIYQWQQKITGASGYTDIPNTNTSSYVATNITTTTTFRRKATDALNNVGYSNEEEVLPLMIASSLSIINNSNVSITCGSVILYSQSTNVSNFNWQKENNGIYENILGATQSTYTATTSGNYRVIGNAECNNSIIVSNICSVNILSNTPPGNPNEFGTGIWRFYGFEGVSNDINLNVYKGFYDNDVPTNPNNFYTQDHWNEFSVPSNLATNTPYTTDWYGCNMPNENSLTVIAKRKGFDCGSYNLWLKVRSGDRLKLVVDGTVVIETYTAPPGFSNEYLSSPITLNANSTIEVWTSSSNAGTFINFEARRISGTNLLGGTISPSTQTLTTGATPALLANATNPTGGNGSSYLYQWEQSNQFIGPFTEITNATGNSLQLGALNQTTYYRRKTYQAGCSYGAYSNVSTITLPQIVTITGGSITINSSTTNICPGSSVSFSNQTSATSTNSGTITYQWQENVTGSSGYVDIPNANTDNYTATNVTQNTTFRRKATDALNNIGYSNQITLSVIVSSPSLIITNNSSVSSSCGNVILNAQASGVLNLQWQKENNGIYENILGATQSTYTASTSGNYRIVGNAQCTNAVIVSNICSVTILSNATGNSLDFGTGIWRFYGFEGVSNDVNLNVYKGFYDNDVPTNPNNVYTQDHWNAFTAPSNLATNTPYTSDWYGCTMTNYDNLTVIAKRKGFDCGSYNLWVRVGSGDRLKLIVDGTVIRETYTAAPGFSNEYLSAPITLNANSTIEVWTSSSTAGTFINFEARRISGTNLLGGTISPSTQTLTTGATPTLLNNATNPTGGNGTSYLYQWEQSNQFIGPFTEIANATNNSLQLGALYQTTYYRRKTYQSGCSYGAYSNVATITLPQLLPITGGSITLNGATNNICSGSSPALIANENAAANGSGSYTYVWQESIDNGNQWTNIRFSNSISYQPPVLSASIKYRRKVTDNNLNTVAYSNEISFIVNSCFVILTGGTISYNNNNTIVCANSNLSSINNTTTASGGAPLYTYEWQIKNANTNIWYNIPNSNTLNYQPAAITNTTVYRRKVTDESGSIAYSNEIVLTEATNNTVLTAGTITADLLVCNNNNTPLIENLSAATNGASAYGLTYTWEQLQNGNWVAISNASSTAASLQNATFIQALTNVSGSYRRKATDFCGNTSYSNEATVRIQFLTPGNIAAGQSSVYVGQTPGLITNQIEPGTGSINNTPIVTEITWLQSSNSGNSWTIINGANGLNYQPSSLAQTTYFKRVAKEALCNITGESNTIVLTVNSIPTSFNGGIIQATTTCIQTENSPGIIEPLSGNNLGGNAPYSYSWEMNNNGTWTVISGANLASYTPDNLTVTTSFRRKVTDASNNTAYSNTITINVQFQQLKAGIIGKSVVVCPNINDTFFYEIVAACGGYGNLNYQWEISNSAGIWTVLSNSNSANYTLSNITADCKIRRRVFDGCGNSAYTNEVDVFIYPQLVAGTISPSLQTVCTSNSQTPQILQLLQNYHYTNGNVSYQWQIANSSNGPWTNIISAKSASYLPKPLNGTFYYRLRVTSSVCNYVGYTNIAVVTGNNFCKTASAPISKKK